MFWSRNFDLKLWYTFEKLNIGIYILIERDKTFMFQGGDSPLLVPLGLKKLFLLIRSTPVNCVLNFIEMSKMKSHEAWDNRDFICWLV